MIDFIDMEEQRNNRSIERRLKEALKNDRRAFRSDASAISGCSKCRANGCARNGRGSTKPCPHCEGRGVSGRWRAARCRCCAGSRIISCRASPRTLRLGATPMWRVYIFNEKCDNLLVLETTYGISIFIVPSADIRTAESVIERAGERAASARRLQAVRMDTPLVEQGKIRSGGVGRGDGRGGCRGGGRNRRLGSPQRG